MHNLTVDRERQNSVRNKLEHSDRRFHDWFRFVLSFPPHLVRQYIKEFNLGETDLLLDPFAGTGTTLIEAKYLNIPSVGIEANPFIHFASSVKTNWEVNSERLLAVATSIKKLSLKQLESEEISDYPVKENLAVRNLRKLSHEKEKLIIKDSISPLPLHKVLVLLEVIEQHKNTPYYQYLLLALGNSIVYQISNLRFGPEVGIGKIKQDSSVIYLWFSELQKICADLHEAKGKKVGRSHVHFADARNISSTLEPESVSAVITSPPYPNEKDYTRTTR